MTIDLQHGGFRGAAIIIAAYFAKQQRWLDPED